MTTSAPDYGTDLDWFSGGLLDMADDGGTVDGLTLLQQAILIHLSTARGSVVDAPDDGIDLVDYLSRALDPVQLANMPGEIEHEILKDERFASCQVMLATVGDPGDLTLTVTIECNSALGPFQLVLSVTDAGVVILGGNS